MRQARPQASYIALLAARRGSAIVEFALILPIFLLLLIGLADLGLGAWYSMQVQSAADSGALYTATHTFDAAQIRAQVVNATDKGCTGETLTGCIRAAPDPTRLCGCPNPDAVPGNPPFTAQQNCTDLCPSELPPGIYITVNARMDYSPIIPWPVLPDPWVLTAQAYRRIN